MAIAAITMPRWGLTMEEGTFIAWLVPSGALVEKGKEIAEVETTKIAGVVEAGASGVLRRQVAEPGQTLPVGALLGVIADADVADSEVDELVSGFSPVEVGGEMEEALTPAVVEVRGLRISYLRRGTGTTTVLLVHGFGGDANGWGFVQPALSSQFDAIALDLPGHGSSGKRIEDGTLHGLARFMLAFLDALGLDRVHIVAHSMGGGAALALAGAHPERIGSLTLLAPLGLGAEINSDYLKAFVSSRRRREVEAALRMLFADESLVTPALAEEIIRFKRLDGAQSALETLLAHIVRDDRQIELVRNQLNALRVPISVIWGGLDRIVPDSHASDLPASIRVERIGSVGHMPHVEAAEQVIRIVRETITAADEATHD
jgi:pyruvate dehydrogenase E2 component (dihydrolipoamide acetyltransferase)